MDPQIKSKQHYLDLLARSTTGLAGQRTPWVKSLRATGAARFSDLGFPSSREEQWKYTNLAPVERQAFISAAVNESVKKITHKHLSDVSFEELDVYQLVFVNGRYAPELSSSVKLPDGLTVGGLADALTQKPEPLEAYLGRIAPVDETHGLNALNTAFMSDGAYVHLARGVAIDKPIHLIFMVGFGDALLTQPRNLIVAEEGSRATLIEHYIAIDETSYFTNALTEIEVASGATIEHYRVQQESVKAFHVGSLYTRINRDSRFTSHAIDLGGLLVRNDLKAVLNSEGAECTLNGLYVVDGRRHVDNHTQIDHAKPHGTSREFYKGVMDGRGRAVFNGRVIVYPDAQHSDAHQMNNNLLLSKDAEVDTKPELEIYADDVKCSHGATVGQIDPDELFYLRTRGLDESAAHDLLTYAFVHDILNRMRLAPIRRHLERRLGEQLLRGRTIREVELL